MGMSPQTWSSANDLLRPPTGRPPENVFLVIASLATFATVWVWIMTGVFFAFVRGQGRQRTVLSDDDDALTGDPAGAGSSARAVR